MHQNKYFWRTLLRKLAVTHLASMECWLFKATSEIYYEEKLIDQAIEELCKVTCIFLHCNFPYVLLECFSIGQHLCR